jgi:hypothetical protein
MRSSVVGLRRVLFTVLIATRNDDNLQIPSGADQDLIDFDPRCFDDGSDSPLQIQETSQRKNSRPAVIVSPTRLWNADEAAGLYRPY